MKTLKQACSKSNSANKRMAIWLFIGCFSIYIVNGDFLLGNDQRSNMLSAVSFVKHGSFTVTPSTAPWAFSWYYYLPDKKPKKVRLPNWDKNSKKLYQQGKLKARNPYYLVKSRYTDTFVSTFGVGASVVLVPIYATINLFVDISSNHKLWWYGAKFTAAMLTALSAMLLFLSLCRFVSATPALIGTLSYALASGAWSISSQALWQQTPFTFFIILGVWFLLGVSERKNFSIYAGAAFGMASLCRPTGIIIALVIGVYLLIIARRISPQLLRYVLGGLPFALILLSYNWYYFGDALLTGQHIAGQAIALQKTGSPELWQTSLVEGINGLLFSPSRGLLFYSPALLLFGVMGAALAWRDTQRFSLLIALQIATLLLFLLQAKWFDWWGGWTFGPRPIVDIGVLLALFMAPFIEKVWRVRYLKTIFLTLLVYGVMVQFIGAWSYNIVAWNFKGNMNIDNQKYRHRLWSLSDMQIRHYSANFSKERLRKQRDMHLYMKDKNPIVVTDKKIE